MEVELEYILYPCPAKPPAMLRPDLEEGAVAAPTGSYVYSVQITRNGEPELRVFHSLHNATGYLMNWMCATIEGTFTQAGGINNWDNVYLQGHTRYFHRTPFILIKDEYRTDYKALYTLLKAYDHHITLFRAKEDYRVKMLTVQY